MPHIGILIIFYDIANDNICIVEWFRSWECDMSESELSDHCDQAQEWGLLFLNFPATNVQYGIYFQLNDLITLLINIFHIRARAARGSLVPGSRTHFLDNYSASAILHRNVVLQFVDCWIFLSSNCCNFIPRGQLTDLLFVIICCFCS